ncbi:MAG: hypothetical protein ACM3NT_11795 [Methylocystaceae bacterium]
MNLSIGKLIQQYIAVYHEEHQTATQWLTPLAAYADADDPRFTQLKEAVGPNHALPHDLLEDAQTVIAYFVPFAKEVVKSNINGRDASKEWALAYIETNQLIVDLNQYIYEQLSKTGYSCSRIPPTHNFDKVKLISDWSHRHVAVIAGLGTLGLNNMLITKKGCCGRIGSLVTNLKIEPTIDAKPGSCLYKNDGTCQKCVKRCVNDAIKADSFDRHRCYQMCLHNQDLYTDLGKADVCGKCVVGIPCSMRNPVSKGGHCG